jgi:hypothetical protein
LDRGRRLEIAIRAACEREQDSEMCSPNCHA